MIKPLRHFADLSQAERALFVYTAAWLVVARVALWSMPFNAARRLTLPGPTVAHKLASIRVSRMAWAVQAAARRIPSASCLTRALVMERMLLRAGRSPVIHIGVSKGEERGFESHAWVEHEGAVVLGDDGQLERFVPMLALARNSNHKLQP